MKKNKAFTIIELLVVIAIIGILTVIITSNFATSKSKARDVKRISDINQIQLVLELLFDRCNTYPSALSIGTVLCGSYSLGTFTSTIPTDSGTSYGYVNTGSDYILRADLENYSSVLIDDKDGDFSSSSDNGCEDSSYYYYCVQSK